jgi:hypothetical protein
MNNSWHGWQCIASQVASVAAASGAGMGMLSNMVLLLLLLQETELEATMLAGCAAAGCACCGLHLLGQYDMALFSVTFDLALSNSSVSLLCSLTSC